jgi:mitochondrial fission protein ELM1
MTHKIAWVITDGSAGMQNQALGLAEALGYEVYIRRIHLRWPWTWLAPYLQIGKGISHTFVDDDPKDFPFPHLVVACGRKSILPGLHLRSHTTRLIYIQDPKISARHFDVVVAPIHDAITGPNVVKMRGAPHHVSPEKINQALTKFDFTSFAGPRLVCFIGGPNRVYDFTQNDVQDLIKTLKTLQKTHNASLLISCSRRTPPEAIQMLSSHFSHAERTFFWGTGEDNPYFALLHFADAFLVTCDSVSMVSEVAATDKPVYLIKLTGESEKFNAFYTQMIEANRIQWLKGTVDFNPVPPFDEMHRVVTDVQDILEKSRMRS